MVRYRQLLSVLVLSLLVGCSSPSPTDWTHMIPESTTALYLPETGVPFSELLAEPRIAALDPLTPTPFQEVIDTLRSVGFDPNIRAMLMIPDASTDWNPVWVAMAEEGIVQQVHQRFGTPFEQTRYSFHEYTILEIDQHEGSLYLLPLQGELLISRSSRAIEDMIRTGRGDLSPMAIQFSEASGPWIVNLPHIDEWMERMADILFRPGLEDLFTGTGAIHLKPTDTPLQWQWSGSAPLSEPLSPLIKGISAPPAPFELDQYIPSSSAAFSLLRIPSDPSDSLPDNQETDGSELDQYLTANPETLNRLSALIEDEIAFVAFSESGFMSSSEFSWIRSIDNAEEWSHLLQTLEDEEFLDRLDLQNREIYHLNSRILSRLIGSPLSTLQSFYLALYGDVVAISRSSSALTSAVSDYQRRRVIAFDPDFEALLSTTGEPISALTWVHVPPFLTYIQPWLSPQHSLSGLGQAVNLIALTTRRNGDSLQLTLTHQTREDQRDPYMEQWIWPLESPLVGAPVFEDISGSDREEILFATRDGMVYGLSADSSPLFQVSTGNDVPLDSPVVFDWYANNQNVVLQVAGDKIYGWNEVGTPLPNFPMTLDEQISTPLTLADVNGNGMAEMIVATADRQVHILDSRGRELDGWPQSTNSAVRSSLTLAEMDGERSLFAFSENSLHGWQLNGDLRDGFPLFIESPFRGSPLVHGDHLFGAAADGNLYAIGQTRRFTVSSAQSIVDDSLTVQSLDLTNSPLVSTPFLTNEMIRVEGTLVRENLLALLSENGSLQMVNPNGELRFSASMGQPASNGSRPQRIDLRQRTRMTALSSIGRLYVWDLVQGTPVDNIPTASMQYPRFHDLNRDGQIELIAQTRDGLHVWTLH
ncbi:MAG: PQQ-binding-like beta-propeller repeat protein [Balneolaceae bacterium]